MSSYGFGYDDELAGGYQDADLEMLELEEAGRNAGRVSSPSVDPPDNPQPPAPREEELGVWLDCCKARGRHRLDCPEELARIQQEQRASEPRTVRAVYELELQEFELEPSGQFSIGVDGEQRALEGLAPEGTPAPLTFERDAAEKAAREELADYAAGAGLQQDRAQAAARTYACGCCGSTLTADEAIYSRFTGARYCPPGLCKTDPKGA